MSYTKNTWVDQAGQVKYTKTDDGSYWILTPNYEDVTEMGTPVNADNLNHIEDGIADCFDYVDTEVASAKNYALNLLKTIYPVGSVYIGTTANCPLASLFGTWTLVSAGRALWTGNGQAGSGTTTQSDYANAKANTTIAAGLPNITGNFYSEKTSSNGAFSYTGDTATDGGNNDSGSTSLKINFNASRSNSTYGKSSTVQPPAYVVNVWRRTA